MHLVYRAIEKEPVPSILPSNLVPPSKRSTGTGSGLDRVLPGKADPEGNQAAALLSLLGLLIMWAYCTVVSLEKPINANTPTVEAMQLSEYCKLETARMWILSEVPELHNEFMCFWGRH